MACCCLGSAPDCTCGNCRCACTCGDLKQGVEIREQLVKALREADRQLDEMGFIVFEGTVRQVIQIGLATEESVKPYLSLGHPCLEGNHNWDFCMHHTE